MMCTSNNCVTIIALLTKFIQALYYSKMSTDSWRTPSPTSSESSYKPFKMKHKTLKRDLWDPPKEWLRFYRCQACKEVMSKKIPTKYPQRIETCGHVTCANCIAKSYLVDLNQLCPVEGCGKCVDPCQKSAVSRLVILTSELAAEPVELVEEPVKVDVHYCGDADCMYDCGVLSCGCIDQCRGRCGNREHLRGGCW